MVEVVGTGIFGAIATWIALSISRPILQRWGAFDVPNHRSSHQSPTVRAGGAGVAIGIVVALIAANVLGTFEPSLLVFGIVLLLFSGLGLVEDVRGLPIRLRLAGQSVFAVLLALGLGQTTGTSSVVMFLMGACMTIFFVNVANFMDGINGISGMHGLVVGIFFSLLGHYGDQLGLTLAGVAIGCCFGAFLPWNSPRARMFLGDAGSYLLGAAISALCLFALSSGLPPLACIAPLAVYSADVVRTLAVRYRRGAKLTDAHRDHVYQQIQRSLSSHLGSALWTVSSTVACCTVAWLSVMNPRLEPLASFVIMMIVVVYLVSPRLLPPTMKVIGR